MKIRKKILLLVVTSLIAFTIFSIIGLIIESNKSLKDQVTAYRNDFMEQKEIYLKDLIDSSYGVLEKNYEAYKNGELTEQEAQESAKKAISKMLFSENGYFFVYTYDGTNLVMPTNKALIGQNLMHLKDQNGVFYLKELVENAKANNGKFVHYEFPKPGTKQAFPKLSYSRGFSEWQWMIGTGIYIDEIDAKIAIMTQTLKNQEKRTIMNFIIIAVIIALFSIFAAQYFISKITKPIEKVVSVLKNLSQGEGDLTFRLNFNSKDEIGLLAQHFNAFIEKLRSMIVYIKDDSQYLASANEQLASSTEQLSSTFEEEEKQVESINNITKEIATSSRKVGTDIETQASSIEETTANVSNIQESTANLRKNSSHLAEIAETTSSALEEISANMQEITENSSNIEEVVSNNKEITIEGKEIILQNKKEIQAVLSNTKNIKEIVNRVSASSNKINDIILLIEDVSDQTNLLALNAAIEAARAGEAGRGFSVVAEEIRKLAERTAKSTQEINTIIREIQKEVESASKATDNSVVLAENTNSVTDKSVAIFDEINKGVNEIASLINHINISISEQNTGNKQLLSSITQLNQIAGEVASGANEQEISISEIKNAMEHLDDLTFKIKISVEEQISGTENINSQITGMLQAFIENNSAIVEIADTSQGLRQRAINLQEMTSKFKTEDGQKKGIKEI